MYVSHVCPTVRELVSLSCKEQSELQFKILERTYISSPKEYLKPVKEIFVEEEKACVRS
jgi:hypothetical protein